MTLNLVRLDMDMIFYTLLAGKIHDIEVAHMIPLVALPQA